MNIKMIIMDVDGTLTDGKIYYASNNFEMKSFNIKDGYAIKHYLPKYNILPVIITGRTSDIVERRADELGVDELYQGIVNKLHVLDALKRKYRLENENIAYIGDDIIDLECMSVCGLVGCPADAAQEVLHRADYVCVHKGGEGAVREFIEYIIKMA